jgi:hypothetical protein
MASANPPKLMSRILLISTIIFNQNYFYFSKPCASHFAVVVGSVRRGETLTFGFDLAQGH